MKDTINPLCIPYIAFKQVRRFAEQRNPERWITKAMSSGVCAANRADDEILQRFRQFSCSVPFAGIDLKKITDATDRDRLLLLADTAVEHRFDLLGSGPVAMGGKIDWHRDFVTGFRWKRSSLYSQIPIIAAPGSDIKRPWELSRCQHFLALGLAGKLSGDEKYLKEYCSQIIDWINSNPVGFGVNWQCPMEAAIRAVNWLVGYALFDEPLSSGEHREFRKLLSFSLWQHARFIRTHLEWSGPWSNRRANHFLSDITGLFTLGVLFRDDTEGKRWFNFAHKYLEVEIRRQVFEDGVHFECSTSYHRLCLEMFLWCESLAGRTAKPFSEGYRQRLATMQTFAAAYTRPDGLAPVVGDNDDGRLLRTGLYNINDHQYLFTSAGKPNIEQRMLTKNAISGHVSGSGTYYFRQGGFYVIKQSQLYLMVRAGPLAACGAHAHNDQLSYELCLGSQPVIVDRGAYVYTSDSAKRNLYRSTASHNVLSINGAEQNRITKNLFSMPDETKTMILETGRHLLRAQHTGFVELDRPGLVQTRSFRISDDELALEIHDNITNVKTGDLIKWYFHLAVGLTAEQHQSTVKLCKNRTTLCRIEGPTGSDVHVEKRCHSPSYGCVQPAEALIFSMKVEENGEYNCSYMISWNE